ncbi:hypothetical protein INS49_012968 [Diaporthe citri]|uniref:uncharacterized protein n=1 Tax=Diaporthe citri TaxID=83186 RepID=UPI001C80BFCB|nr:uncharacterized protein INS49_012968 [Diaporthe citri]KAG6359447.1 hypothetical protein INS49_012968 [Diaporthe citri]
MEEARKTSPDFKQAPKSSRASSHRARTGCITCKRRHVKCDEARPHCSNCRNGNRVCEGYVATAAKRARVPSTMQVCWNSKSTTGTRGTTPSSSPMHSASLQEARLIPTTLGVKDDKARLYFDEFVSLVRGPWITASAASGADLWEVTLPQLARSNATIQHAAIAIGAMSLWHRQSRLDGGRPRAPSVSTVRAPGLTTTEVAIADAHYLDGVGYYCHSLKLQSRSESIQDAVLLSVLLLTFETLRADRQAALQHVNHGLSLLLAIATDQNGRLDALAPDPRPILESVAGVFTHLATSARSILHGRIGQCRPLPNFAEALKAQKQTLHSFTELVSRLPRASAAVENVPAAFGTLEEFEEHWAAARHRQHAMEAMIVDMVKSSGVLETTSVTENEDFWVRLMESPDILKVCADTRDLIEALAPAFEPLFNKIIMSDGVGSRPYLRALHLRLQYMATYVFANPPKYLDLESLQAQTPLFREYLSLVDLALRALSFHCEVSWYLFVISIFCRDPLVRDEALCKLRDYPGHDGLWDARSLYALARRNRDVELANSVEGTPLQQWRRLWRREYVFEDGGARIIFRYLEKDAPTGEWQLVEEAAEIWADSDDVRWERQPLTDEGRLLMGTTVSF